MPAKATRVCMRLAAISFTAVGLLTALALPSVATADTSVATDAPGVEFNILESTDTRTLVEVVIPEMVSSRGALSGGAFDVVGVPGAEPYGEPGHPALQVAATLIAVPPTSGVTMHVLEEESTTLQGYRLAPMPDPNAERAEPVPDATAYSYNGLLPGSAVSTDAPAIMRDYRVVPLRVYPIRYNAVSGEISLLRRALVEFSYGEGKVLNPLLHKRGSMAKSFRPIYESSIANYDATRSEYESDSSGRYIIITHDNYYEAILPLAEWKHRRGMEVEVAKLSEIGSSSSQIKTYLQDAYDTWSSPPEYVLLVGDTEQTPSGSEGDDYYAKLAGSDYLVDVNLARFSCDTVAQCELLVSKTLGYKRTPVMSDPNWFKSACLIVRADGDTSDLTYYTDTWHAYDLMETAGYVKIDTLFSIHGADESDVYDSVTEGRTFVNYRGQGVSNWWSPFGCDPQQTNPGFKLPVVMSATCGTGSYWYDGYPCETWMRAGTSTMPRGAVGFCGTYEIVSHGAFLRSCVNQGFYSAIFNLKIRTLTAALNYGKLRVYQLYGRQDEYQGWNSQGDPELDIWTTTPRMLDVTHAETVPTGLSDLTVEVEADGNPIPGALVCAYLDGQVYESGVTSSSGIASLYINPSTADTLLLTVTGHNMHPYEATIEIVPSGSYLLYGSHAIDDSAYGNDDGVVNPGETVSLTVGVLNSGTEDALGVTGELASSDPYVALVDSTDTYGTIPDGDTVTNPDPFEFEVAADCPDGHDLQFTVAASDAGRPTWIVLVPDITVAAANLEYSGAVVDDDGSWGNGNGVLDPGETAWVTVTLDNDGQVDLEKVAGLLSTSDPYVAVTDATGRFGEIASGGSASCSANAFRVSVSPGAPPAHQVTFTVEGTGEAETYTHVEDVGFDLTLGGTASSGPSGPDTYGYYAYDQTDVASGRAPTYSWVELAGTGTKISAITDQDAQTAVLSLPFTFRYYGGDYTQVSVCSNGFLAMGSEDYRLGDNDGIPSTHGPDAMIAPFWDDLDPSESGDVYEWYDSANHRYIVQFDACVHYGGGNPETFEVILYDPSYYPTGTGDGIIVYQYQDVAFIYSMTMGIENPSQTYGIQYLYNSTYGPNAATVVDGFAVKFTTEPPASADVWLVVDDVVVDDAATGNNDGIIQPGETVDLIVTIGNRLGTAAPAVSATLTTGDPDAQVLEGTSSFGDIPGSGSADNSSDPFTVSVTSVPNDDTIEFEIAIATGGRYLTTDVVTVDLDLSQTGIPEAELPLALALRQNYPNPFRAGTAIAFGLPSACEVRIDIYNVAGRRVAGVLDATVPAGWHEASWDGRDTAGNEVSAGMYFYRIEAGSETAVRKMILVR